MDESTLHLKFKHLDISSIASLISPLGENGLSNEEFTYWYDALNNGEKDLTDFINKLKPQDNRINISTFLEDPVNIINSDKIYTLQVIVYIKKDDKHIIDGSDKVSTISFQPVNTHLLDNSLSELKGKFKSNDNGYYFQIESFETLMPDWGTFKF